MVRPALFVLAFAAFAAFVARTDAQASPGSPPPGVGPLQWKQDLEPRPRLFAAVQDPTGPGAIVELTGGPPWSAEVVGTGPDGARLLRHFGEHLYAVGPTRAVWRVPADGSAPSETVDLGTFVWPRDVHVLPDGTAYATASMIPSLLRVDFATGASVPVVDFDALAAANEQVSVGTMERDGSRLFVQLRFDTVTDDPEAGSPAVRGALAVVDLATETLIDLDPVAPGVQGIDLVGEPPHGKMTFQPRRRLLYVSSTGVALNVAGGIEKVDIDAGVSMGLVVTEKQIGLDLGGFVFTSEDGGYLMFHTEIIPSTHLTRFTVPGGISGISQFFGLLGDAVNVLVHDPSTNTLFLPSGDAFAPGTGVYAFDTDTDTLIGGAVNTGMRPHDILLIE